MNPLQTLQAYTRASALDESNVYLSDDGKTLFFLGGSAPSQTNLPQTTADASVHYDATSPSLPEDDNAPYTLAALYLLCMNPKDYVPYRKACERHGGIMAVKVTHRGEILKNLMTDAKDAAAPPDAAAATAAAAAAGTGTTAVSEDTPPEEKSSEEAHKDQDAAARSSRSEEERKRRERRHAKERERHHAKDHRGSRPTDKERDRRHAKEKHDRDRGRHHKHGKPASSSATSKEASKAAAKPMTNEQVLENLTLVADKRAAKMKRKEDKRNMGDDVTTTSTDQGAAAANTGEATQDATTTDGSIPTDPTSTTAPTDPTSTETDPPKDDPEQTGDPSIVGSDAWHAKVQRYLSAAGYIPDNPQSLESDRVKTQHIVSMEIPVGNAYTILRAEGRDLTKVLDMFMSRSNTKSKESSSKPSSSSSNSGSGASRLGGMKRTRDHHRSSTRKPTSSSTSSSSDPNKRPRREPTGLPLIIVPNAMTSPITMLNAEEFFSKAKFTPRDVVLKTRGRTALKKSIQITRRVNAKYGGGEVTYEIVDNPSKLFHSKSKKDWERIVAVVALGAAWQFKGWLWSNPVDLFSRTMGFYIGMEGAPPPKELMGWNVKKCALHRDKRGLDGVTFASFWNSLDEWMSVHKPEYFPRDDM